MQVELAKWAWIVEVRIKMGPAEDLQQVWLAARASAVEAEAAVRGAGTGIYDDDRVIAQKELSASEIKELALKVDEIRLCMP
jgi:hypothetical protein